VRHAPCQLLSRSAAHVGLMAACAGKQQTGQRWLATGLDKGSLVHDSATVTSAQIVAWGVRVLHAPETPATPPH
jgi:hypothetical protein